MLGIIGGTGFGEFAGLEDLAPRRVFTRYGEVNLQSGTLDGRDVLFLPRHGQPANTPPHKINYRANIQALYDEGVTGILAVTAVGSVDESLLVPQIVIPDQIIDYSWGREHTFFEDTIHHIDFTFPYEPGLRGLIVSAAQTVCAASGVALRDGAVYGCTQGPRLETAAEIMRLARDGCHIVGMTGMPETALACEREIPYAGLSVVVNAGAGIGGAIVDLESIKATVASGMEVARDIVQRVIRSYSSPTTSTPSSTSGGS